MKVYTKTGDKGKSTLPGKRSIPKKDQVFKVLGSIDELNASLGIAVSFHKPSHQLHDFLLTIQNYLFDMGGEVAQRKVTINWDKRTKHLESLIDNIDSKNKPITNFILPGGSQSSSHLHLSRVICRRAERQFWTWEETEGEKYAPIASYLNRLSDFLFVLARSENKNGEGDILWIRNKQ